ncbi:MAG: hypothetical protein IID32_10815, partial [Planctomycetes bacterium]|nr:hypothetical protein [Planctomycetota bacterium]
SGGRLTATPRLLLERDPGLFVLPAGPVLQNVRLSPELCRGWLKFVAPLIADSTEIDGRLSVEMTRTKVPLDDWRSSAVAGVLKIHSAHVSPGPLARRFLEIAEQVKAIQNLKIDKITVWDSGQSGNGQELGTTAGFLRSLIGALPPIHELAQQAGIDLPEVLGKIGKGKTETPLSQTPPPKRAKHPGHSPSSETNKGH